MTDQKTVVDRVLDLAHKILPGTDPPPPPTPRILEAPPPEAHEVTQPLTAEARGVPADQRGNEKELAPLTYADSPGAPVPVVAALTAATPAAGAVRPVVPGVAPVVPLEGLAPLEAAALQDMTTPTVPTVPAVVAPPETYQPAASATESPARGAMRHDPDPLHRPTGGWGPAPSTEYHPLNGAEVCTVVLGLFEELHAQIPHDLRFSHALTYPRIEVRVTVDVVTYPPESSVRITKIAPDPKGQAPREVALARADECCFVIMTERVEQDAAGTSINPPDKLREEVDLPLPHKHLVGTGVARQLVDSASPRTHDVAGNPLAPDGTPIVAPTRQAVLGAGGQPRMTPAVIAPPPRPASGGPG